jgi:hypothetical protein
MKNSTLGRKTGNTMKKNSGTSHEPKRNNQRGDGADFAFNGQMGDGVNRDESRAGLCWNPNAHLVDNPDRINHGTFAASRRGNTSDQSRDRMERIGPSATRDEMRMTIATAGQGHNIGAIKAPKKFPNPDAINVGMK